MSTRYSADDILKMAVGKLEADLAADLDGDGKITSADARLAARRTKGIPDDTPAKASSVSVNTPNTPSLRRGDTGSLFVNTDSLDPAGGGGVTGTDPETALMKRELLQQLLKMSSAFGQSGFQMDSEKLYNELKNSYTEGAKLSSENVYGLLSSNTGGYGNSYASSAASAAYNDYMKGLSDRLLELESLRQSSEKLELSRETERIGALYKALGLLDDYEQRDYDRYQDGIKLAFDAAGIGDYYLLASLGIDASALYNNDRMKEAVSAAKYGDYTLLNDLGVDTDALTYNELLERARILANYGDYSGLEALGVNTASLYENNLFDRALSLAKYGDYSLLGNFTDNLPTLKEKISLTVQKGAEEAYYYGGYANLIKYLNKQLGYGQISEEGKKQIIKVLTGG